MATSSIFLDALRTIRAPLGQFANDGQSLVLLMKSIFGARLVLFAGLVLVPRAIAGNASFGATVLAGADIWCARAQDEDWSRIRFRVYLGSDCGADASSDPAGPVAAFGLTQLDRIVFGAWRAFIACAAFVNLPRLASWSKTPAPPRSILCDVPALKLGVPRMCCQSLLKR